MKVSFLNVGRQRACWLEELPGELDAVQEVYEAVLKKRVLMSRDVEVVADENGVTGTIYAGINLVGRFEVVP